MKLKNNLSDFELDLYDFESNFVRFAALCLPFGLPFGREHCVVPAVGGSNLALAILDPATRRLASRFSHLGSWVSHLVSYMLIINSLGSH